MLAEVEDRLVLFVKNDAACIVDQTVAGGEVGEELDVVLQSALIPVELGFEDFVCGPYISKGGVGVIEVLVAVESIGGHQRALLHLVEDVLDVNEFPFAEVEIDAGTQEFFRQQRNVETGGVVACDVAAFHPLGERFGYLAENRLVLDVVVADVVDFLRFPRDGHLGVDEPAFLLDVAVGEDLHGSDLDDAVARNVKPCRLQIEKQQGIVEFEFHYGL